MRIVTVLFAACAAFALSACATTDAYDGCHGIGCEVDNPDQ